jgi:NADH dehydrogenase [ubiquinone] 1 alpha subcomplex assembly factor 7
MDGDVRERIVRTIRNRGPIAFDAFMELSLYGEGGYYERPPVGPAGDFVTSPHVHWWFAYALGVALGSLHDAIGADRPVRLVEFGAGDGTLARQVLEILGDAGPIGYTAVERSAGARERLSALGVDVGASVEDVDGLDGALLFANELLDNLPFRRVRRRGDALVEVRVGLADDRLVEVETDPEDVLSSRAPSLENGAEAAIPTGALALVDALAERMRHSYALLIDYSTERGTQVHGYRRQRVVADVLDRPGSADVTAAVDFDLVEAHARERGLSVLGRVTQRDALLALGFGEWTARERDRLSTLGASEATRAWAARSRATLLVDPNGLGAHRWVLLATPGLPAPAWLEAARPARPAD